MRLKVVISALLFGWMLSYSTELHAQVNEKEISVKRKSASKKAEKGIIENIPDTAAQGYFSLGESYYQQGNWQKSETYFLKARNAYDISGNKKGSANASRWLAKAQEQLNKPAQAATNYSVAAEQADKTGDIVTTSMNRNDLKRLNPSTSDEEKKEALKSNIELGWKKNDSLEAADNYYKREKLAIATDSIAPNVKELGYSTAKTSTYASIAPAQALELSNTVTQKYIQQKDFDQAIISQKSLLTEPFVQQSSLTKAHEIRQLASIYVLKDDKDSAITLLRKAYQLATDSGHTFEARLALGSLDSLYSLKKQTEQSIELYREFLHKLPELIRNDSSLTDNRIIADAEERLRILENEKRLKDELIVQQTNRNGWLTAFVGALLLLLTAILYLYQKLRKRNQRIALQSLRREMNPHFIFNSLNSINQFIAVNNELAANQYLSRFSTLMRNVMENSADDFVQFQKELAMLKNYLELERSRFPDKFDFEIEMNDELMANEHIFIPGMLIQPHIENAIWHGLRYLDHGGKLTLRFRRLSKTLEVQIEDNGIGMAASKLNKTSNQKKHRGRGMSNTEERIRILNQLYSAGIHCSVTDKPAPSTGVLITIEMPFKTVEV